MSLTFRSFDDAASYAERVLPFLLAAEAENNVLLGILVRLVSGDHDYREPMLLGVVERIESGSSGDRLAASTAADGSVPGASAEDTGRQGAAVVGCIWRTPPYKLGMTAMPGDAAIVAAKAIAPLIPELDMAFGPTDTVRQFAKAWSKLTRGGYSEGMRQGVYRLDEVNPLPNKVQGQMVEAVDADLQLIIHWGIGFRRDSHVQAGDPEVLGRRLIREGAMYLWIDDGEPRSMAAAVAFTENGARVGWVYTPREERGRGYATGLVADLSQLLLDGGKRFCFLYADLANPTSTGIYERLGYRKVVEAMDVIFDVEADERSTT
ncbi:MAG: GNAT family N-acetyltransferase [Rhodothermia bacterium]|nr:GNAT family N-acetyltransferase [Rhodothermia bacterium]NNL46868.1 GNAT family N-acetyltransferase [Acidimicrobiia bacterium]